MALAKKKLRVIGALGRGESGVIPVILWLLSGGLWNDDGLWVDTETWID